MTTPVYYSMPGSYDPEPLRQGLQEILEPLLKEKGGISGKKILLKPNLLFCRYPDDPAAVNPALIVAVAEFLVKAGASVTILENPGTQNVSTILSKMGIAEKLEALQIPFADFADYRPKQLPEACKFRQLTMAREFENFDLVLDLAKAKTHAMMTLTLAIKNLFGLIGSADRIAWHLAVGSDFSRFADLLVDLYLTVKPGINIIDGVISMEGNGPGSGTPVSSGFLAASSDALALDASVSKVLGVKEEKLPILIQARKRGLDLAFEDHGSRPELPPCKLPDPPGMLNAWGVTLPPFFKKQLRNLVGSRPLLTRELCISCGRCAEVCPPRSLKMKLKEERKLPSFDLNNCIRCYCCQEHCPKGAIKTQPQILTALVSRIAKLVRH